MIDLNSTFDSDPGSNFASLSGWGGSSPSASYDANNQAINLSAQDGSAWVITSQPVNKNTETLSFEAELEFISDPNSRKHVGLWLVKDSPLVIGYRIAHLDNKWLLSKWSSWSSETVISITPVANPTFNVGDRKKLRVERSSQYIKFYVDNVLVFSCEDSSYFDLRPGVFFWSGSVKVHSVHYQIYDASIRKLNVQSLFWCNFKSRDESWPGENSCKQTASQTAKKAYGVTTSSMLNAPPLRKDFGFIEGVVTRKTAAAVGQHVICLDDRFNLVAETLSGAGGYYRFDSLPINGLYAIHAYDNNEYKYAPVGADRRTPEAYS